MGKELACLCVRARARTLDSPLACSLVAGTALDDAIREGHNKVAEGLAGYYRVMEHSVDTQMPQSVKLDDPLRKQAEAVMLTHEKDRSGKVLVDITPSGSGSEPTEELSESKPPSASNTADRASKRGQTPNTKHSI